MSAHVKLLRGTSTQNDAFTGAEGVVTADVTNKRLRLHDGATAGGIALAKLSEILAASSLGTGVQTALGIAVGTIGGILTRNGALGTPSSGTLTSCTGLPPIGGLAGVGVGSSILRGVDPYDLDPTILAMADCSSVISTAIDRALAENVPLIFRREGVYKIGAKIYKAAADGLEIIVQPGVTLKGLSSINDKLFDLRGNNIVVRGHGLIDGSEMANSASEGDAFDALTIIGDNTVVAEMSFYTGDDYASAGSDSHIFLAGSNLLVEHTKHEGAKDLAVYISERTSTTPAECHAIVRGLKIKNCQFGVAAKRGYDGFLVEEIYVEGGRYGAYTGHVTDVALAGKTAQNFTVRDCQFVGMTDINIIARVTDHAMIVNNRIINPTAFRILELEGSSYGTVTGNTIYIDPAVYVSPSDQRGIAVTSYVDSADVTHYSTHNLIAYNTIVGVDTPIYEVHSTDDYNAYMYNNVAGNASYTTTGGVRVAGANSKLYTHDVPNVLTLGSPAGASASQLKLDGAAGVTKRVQFKTGGVDHWRLEQTTDAETGGNVGGTFQITRQDDTGSSIGTPISIARSTGIVTFQGTPKLPSYTVATLPTASLRPSCLCYVSDGASSKRLAVCDGSNWRFPDGTIVS